MNVATRETNGGCELLGAVERQKAERQRIFSLDGLRAISIILVLLGHLGGTRGFSKVDLLIGDYAHLGVTVFFVISGFLITTLLMSEHATRGSVSLRSFYERRALRIFPASYAYLAVIGILGFIGVVSLNARDLWCGALYVMNYLPQRSWVVGHLWSLSVEEQFYLLWPLAFVMLRKKGQVRIIAAVIVVSILARAANRVAFIGTPLHDLEIFPSVADSLAIGCLLAILKEWLERQRWYLKLLQPGWSLLVLLTVLLLNRWAGRTVDAVVGTTLINVGIAVLIHRCVSFPNDAVGTILNWRPLAALGVLSYSLYLWQQLFLNRWSTAWVNAFPQNLLFALAAALCSYFLLEKPLMGLRKRLART
jgi:peptidoglycan/LPS O-acetylase OafA/YrhL